MHNNERGLTLIEILAALVILSMLIVLVMNMSTFSIKSQGSSDTFSTATFIAEKELNRLRNQIKTNASYNVANFETDPIAPYTVMAQELNVPIDGSSPNYTAVPVGMRHVSMQSIIYRGGLPRLLNVTVYWSETA